MTKEQQEEMKTKANEIYPSLHPAWSSIEKEAYKLGFEVGVESEKKRAQALVEALRFIRAEERRKLP